MGGLQREARGPRHESPLWQQLGARPSCRGRRRGQAPARGVEHSALSSHSQDPTSPGSAWHPPRSRVSPCGLRWQRCWPGEAAGRWERVGRSPLRFGEPPRRSPGKPEAGERRCPLLGLGATRGRRQKRVRVGEESHPDPPRPRPRPGGQRTPFFFFPPGEDGRRHPAREKPAACGKRGGSGTRLPGAHPPAAKLSSRPGWEQRWAGAPWPTSPGPGEGRASQPRGRSAGAPRSGRPSPNPPGPGLPGAPTRTARAPCRRQGPGALTGRVGGRSGGRRFPG